MTYLTATPADFAGTVARVAVYAERRPRPLAAALACAIVMVGATVPGAVVQAKWSKLGLVVANAQHRCLATWAD